MQLQATPRTCRSGRAIELHIHGRDSKRKTLLAITNLAGSSARGVGKGKVCSSLDLGPRLAFGGSGCRDIRPSPNPGPGLRLQCSTIFNGARSRQRTATRAFVACALTSVRYWSAFGPRFGCVK
ncbi:hypothetical protein MRB53_040512 [Persea americana]|nr:hypothetical protein MRB53_040512 [Persea americana]